MTTFTRKDGSAVDLGTKDASGAALSLVQWQVFTQVNAVGGAFHIVVLPRTP